MRAISVRQPHAWAIIHGGKDVENRSQRAALRFKPAIGERMLIHASKTMTAAEYETRGVHGQHRRPLPPPRGVAVRRRDRLGFRARHRLPQRQPVVPKGRNRSCVHRRTGRAVHAGARPARPVLGPAMIKSRSAKPPSPRSHRRTRVWLAHNVVNHLRAMRGRGESYSEVILRLAKA